MYRGCSRVKIWIQVPCPVLPMNSKDVPWALLMLLLWDWLGYIQALVTFGLGLGPDYCQTIPWKPLGLPFSAR